METKSDMGVTDGANIENTVRLRGGRCSFCYSAKPLIRGGFDKNERNFRKDFKSK